MIIGLWEIRSIMEQERREKLKSVVELSLTIVESFYERSQAGEFSTAEAQEQAREVLRDLRYDEGEYVFANNAEGVNIVHGMKPQLEGVNMIEADAARGHRTTPLMHEAALAGGGFTNYEWERDKGKPPVDKAAYTMYFEPWGWVVGTGLYMDDIQAAFWTKAKIDLGIMAVLLLVLGAVVFVSVRNIVRPIGKLVAKTDAIAAGETEGSVPGEERRDELGTMARALSRLKEKVDEAFRVAQMVEVQPARVMMCDPGSLEITYANKAAKELLKRINHPVTRDADHIVGKVVTDFHKNPEMVRRLLTDPSRLPYKGKFSMGGVTIENHVTAIYDRQGRYVGPMLNWEDVTKYVQMTDNFEKDVKAVTEHVATAAKNLEDLAAQLMQTVTHTEDRSTSAASGSEQTSANVQTVAAATEELSSSISEIARQVSSATSMASSAVAQATEASRIMDDFEIAANEIGEVVNTITDVASQTNLLALNATIEAARAGEAGKGFAVVANEVKSLANQTQHATESIAQKIANMQERTTTVTKAIRGITETIRKVDEIATSIAGAVEEQTAATDEITRNVEEAASGTQNVSSNVAEVARLAGDAKAAVGSVRKASEALSEKAGALNRDVDDFLGYMKTA